MIPLSTGISSSALSHLSAAGASRAAAVGAVAALVRSVASLSINSPHTGIQDYDPNVTRIPVASITIEDAEMLARMQARGIMPVVHLYMEAQSFPDVVSYNVVGEITGALYPDQVRQPLL